MGLNVRLLVLLVVSAALGACSGSSEPDVEVLFIGNSFTHSNDLPGVVEEIAEANGTSIDVTMLAPGGWFLDQHVASAETMEAIRSGRHDFVVLQEQSMAPSHGATFRDRTVPAAMNLSSTAQAAGAEVILFETWGHVSGNPTVGHASYESMQDALIAAYQHLGRELGATVAPVGERWRTSRTELPAVVLYAADGVHPSSEGTYLAAATITSSIVDAPLTEFPAADIDPTVADQLGSSALADRTAEGRTVAFEPMTEERS